MDANQSAGAAGTTAATRAAILAHVDAFNAHDTSRVIDGLEDDVVRVTGSDVFRGTWQLREGLFDESLWQLKPSLDVRALVVEGEAAAARFHEILVGGDERREFDIAAFSTVRDGAIRSVTVFREGSADLEP